MNKDQNNNHDVSEDFPEINESDNFSEEQYSIEESEVITNIGEPKPDKPDLLTEILDTVKLLLIVLVISLLLTQYVIQRNTVKGPSMLPNLEDGDELFVEKVSRYFGAINRFDIITINTNGLDEAPNRVIKRVIGLPGETVKILDGVVYINGLKLEEPYISSDVITSVHNRKYESVTLGEGEYYVLGDNRTNSNDSRAFGPVPQGNILGKLLVRFYPFNKIGKPK